MSKSEELRERILALQEHFDMDLVRAAEISAEYVAPLEADNERLRNILSRVVTAIHKATGNYTLLEPVMAVGILAEQLTEARQRAEQAELTCQSKQDAIDTLMAEVKAASERAEKAEAACAAMLQLCEWVDNTIGWRDTYYEAEGTVPPIIDIETDWCNPRVKLEMIPDSAKEILRRMEQAEAEVGRLRELLDESPVSGEALTAMGFNRNEEYGFWFNVGSGVEWDEGLGVVFSNRLCQENVTTMGRFRMLVEALSPTTCKSENRNNERHE